MKHTPDTDWKPECSHCRDTMQVKCQTCAGKGCMDCGYQGWKYCPYCTKPRKQRRLRRIDLRG